MAANIAAQRPPWEASQIMREELSTILSNRSAAYYELGDYVSALTDAETVIQLKRPWSKGHFRKARALMKLEKYQEARDAIQLGLSFEIGNVVCLQFMKALFEYWLMYLSGNVANAVRHRFCHEATAESAREETEAGRSSASTSYRMILRCYDLVVHPCPVGFHFGLCR